MSPDEVDCPGRSGALLALGSEVVRQRYADAGERPSEDVVAIEACYVDLPEDWWVPVMYHSALREGWMHLAVPQPHLEAALQAGDREATRIVTVARGLKHDLPEFVWGVHTVADLTAGTWRREVGIGRRTA